MPCIVLFHDAGLIKLGKAVSIGRMIPPPFNIIATRGPLESDRHHPTQQRQGDGAGRPHPTAGPWFWPGALSLLRAALSAATPAALHDINNVMSARDWLTLSVSETQRNVTKSLL